MRLLLWWVLVLSLFLNPLRAVEEHETDAVDLFLIFNQINQLNQVIETYKKTLKEVLKFLCITPKRTI